MKECIYIYKEIKIIIKRHFRTDKKGGVHLYYCWFGFLISYEVFPVSWLYISVLILSKSSYKPRFPGQPPLRGILSEYPVFHLLVALPAAGSIHALCFCLRATFNVWEVWGMDIIQAYTTLVFNLIFPQLLHSRTVENMRSFLGVAVYCSDANEI